MKMTKGWSNRGEGLASDGHVCGDGLAPDSRQVSIAPAGIDGDRDRSGIQTQCECWRKGQVNPLPATPENIRAGQESFSHYRMVCHGRDGQHTRVPFPDRMFPPVPLLNSPIVQRYADGQLKGVIDHGIFPSGMPASPGILNGDEIWQIVHSVHLPPSGSLGEPPVDSGK